jgi:hypothetical protein
MSFTPRAESQLGEEGAGGDPAAARPAPGGSSTAPASPSSSGGGPAREEAAEAPPLPADEDAGDTAEGHGDGADAAYRDGGAGEDAGLAAAPESGADFAALVAYVVAAPGKGSEARWRLLRTWPTRSAPSLGCSFN